MDAWYSVLSMGFGYLSALLILLVVVISVRKTASDQRIYRKVVREKRQVAYAGELVVLTGSGRKLQSGDVLGIPYEGTIGAASGCDVVLSVRRLHMRSAFFWVEQNQMHMVPVQRDTILVDDEPLKPGDEAVMTSGAVLSVNGVKMELHIFEDSPAVYGQMETPYVTKARRAQVHLGRGKGFGNSGSIRPERKGRGEQ
ncbi:MAG: hypothetical protein IJT77_05255 [Clostridia bacterium]|nr:hypothetical protein [Clostridia bacterium]